MCADPLIKANAKKYDCSHNQFGIFYIPRYGLIEYVAADDLTCREKHKDNDERNTQYIQYGFYGSIYLIQIMKYPEPIHDRGLLILFFLTIYPHIGFTNFSDCLKLSRYKEADQECVIKTLSLLYLQDDHSRPASKRAILYP